MFDVVNWEMNERRREPHRIKGRYIPLVCFKFKLVFSLSYSLVELLHKVLFIIGQRYGKRYKIAVLRRYMVSKIEDDQ